MIGKPGWFRYIKKPYIVTLLRSLRLQRSLRSIISAIRDYFGITTCTLRIWDGKLFTPQALEFYGRLNFLKGGIVFADAVTTVSRKYMEEIQTKEFGAGLDGVLRDRQGALYGILNGVDYQEWSPEVDPFIKQRYSASDLRGKTECKVDLQEHFGLPVDLEVPLFGMISRLTEQKGFDLIASCFDAIMAFGIQLVILGTGKKNTMRCFGPFNENTLGSSA
jgi:starch synthase